MATYNPTKNYTWNPDAKFVISGQDLGLILNTLRGVLATQEATNAIMAYEANKRIEDLVAKSVEDGSIYEIVDGQPMTMQEEDKPAGKQLKKVK
jgi:hypothetical protein